MNSQIKRPISNECFKASSRFDPFLYKLNSIRIQLETPEKRLTKILAKRADFSLKIRIERILVLTMTLSKMITFTVTAISLAQAVSLRLDIKRGGTDPIVQLRMHELIELISQKRDLGMRTAVIQKVKDGGKLTKGLRLAIYKNQSTRGSNNQSRRRHAKSSRFNRYKNFHSLQKS